MKINGFSIQVAKSYLSGVIVYGLGIILFRNAGYYKETLSSTTQDVLLLMFVLYLVLAPFYYYFNSGKASKGRAYLFLAFVKKWAAKAAGKKTYEISHNEKTAFLFMLVKLFFLPTMVNFFFNNFKFLIGMEDIEWYPLILLLIFTIDTLIFAIGYAFEARIAGNVVKSVEPTLLGWAVALISYPPFNSFAGKFVPWGANDYVYFWNSSLTNIIRAGIVLLLLIYLWASIALGFKASNLTNRGIIAKFPYSMIRHPAYAAKNLAWWITLLPVMNWKFALGMLFWTIIYYFRAITEENHLKKDPDYVEYCRKVKYRFIPYVV